MIINSLIYYSDWQSFIFKSTPGGLFKNSIIPIYMIFLKLNQKMLFSKIL